MPGVLPSPSADNPRPHAKVVWQPRGQGHKLRITIVPAADVPALHRWARREFQAEMAIWEVSAFTAGDESDRSLIELGRMSDSSSAKVPPEAFDWPVWMVQEPEKREHPPDG
jgi:hypothetical protein